ncbi:MAG: YbaN family protein [Bacteroidales bacterium]
MTGFSALMPVILASPNKLSILSGDVETIRQPVNPSVTFPYLIVVDGWGKPLKNPAVLNQYYRLKATAMAKLTNYLSLRPVNTFKRIFFIVAGSLALGLGTLGVFVPGLPTTPFLLLSAALYLRSSEKLHQYLINHRYLGKYIHRYHTRKGMSMRTKIYAILLMWSMIALSSWLFIDELWLRLLLLVLGITGSIVMGLVVKTWREK